MLIDQGMSTVGMLQEEMEWNWFESMYTRQVLELEGLTAQPFEPT